jgi:nicotinate-nucleotide pyrophosphorylase (carboxylating)
MDLPSAEIDRVIDMALAEDVGRGDVTSEAVVPASARLTAEMHARQPLVLAGIGIAARVFRRLAPDASVEVLAERTALNIVQHLSGIATLTRSYVDRVAGTGAVILDTRKTIPGLRALAKYATRTGGAQNHRMGLFDAVLIKDNHIAVCGGIGPAVATARAAGLNDIEVECDTLAQVKEALACGVARLLLDNMDLPTLKAAVGLAKGRAKTEASGGVSLETVRAIAETGVDYVSIGRITQSAPAVDIGLDYA